MEKPSPDSELRRHRHGTPKYRATVQVLGLAGDNAHAVRAALDEQLRKLGLEHCRVVAVDIDAPVAARARVAVDDTPEARRERPVDAAALLLVGAAAWAIWFFWLMLSSSP